MLLIIAVVLLFYFLYINSCKPRGYPPGPVRLPLVGFLPYIKKECFHKQATQLSSTYGNVIGLYFGTKANVVVNGWDAVKDSLLNDQLNGRPENLIYNIIFDGKQRGMLYVEKDFFKEQRRFTLHQFRNLGFGKQSSKEVIHEEVNDLIKEIQETEGSILIKDVVGVSAINILWALMGGKRFSRSDDRLLHLVKVVNDLFSSGDLSRGIVSILPGLRHILPESSSFKLYLRSNQRVFNFIRKTVEEHKETFDPDNLRDFIDIYINEVIKRNNIADTTFTDDQLIALCGNIFIAGVETQSSYLSYGFLLTILHPHVMVKIHQELDAVVGHSRLPSNDDRKSLVYTNATLMETFRFRCPTPITVPHRALTDTELQGHRIPAGTVVLNNIYSVHVDPEYWGDPHTFRPERFINPDGSLRVDERLIPFGKGNRSCLGESLARMETFLLFSSLMHHFTFTLDPTVPVSDTEGKMGLTLAPPQFRVFAKARV